MNNISRLFNTKSVLSDYARLYIFPYCLSMSYRSHRVECEQERNSPRKNVGKFIHMVYHQACSQPLGHSQPRIFFSPSQVQLQHAHFSEFSFSENLSERFKLCRRWCNAVFSGFNLHSAKLSTLNLSRLLRNSDQWNSVANINLNTMRPVWPVSNLIMYTYVVTRQKNIIPDF